MPHKKINQRLSQKPQCETLSSTDAPTMVVVLDEKARHSAREAFDPSKIRRLVEQEKKLLKKFSFSK